MKYLFFLLFLLFPFPVLATTVTPPPTYTWCVLKLVQTQSKEMISAAYGMGNVGNVSDLNQLCEDFYTRDVRAEGRPVVLIDAQGSQVQTDPDQFWMTNTWRRALTAQELEQYKCLFQGDGDFLGLLNGFVNGAVSQFPQSPDSIRIPALIVSAASASNSPILNYALAEVWRVGLPLASLAAAIKFFKLSRR